MSDHEPKRLTHDEIQEMLPAFVVGALDPDEMLAVEEYIHAHPEWMERVHELELAAARLAYSAPPQPLPKEAHEKVLQRARASLPPRTQAAPAAAPHPSRAQMRPARPASPQPPIGKPREYAVASWWRRRGLFDLALVAAVAAVLVLTIVYQGALSQVKQLQAQLQEVQQQIATIQEQNTNLQNENTRLQGALDSSQNQLASIAGAQEIVALAGTEADPGASGALYVNDNTATLVLNNLQPLGEDQVYQLWLIPAQGQGAPIPAGLLGHAGGATQTITLELPATMKGIAAVGVSVEPPSGSTAPTGPIVLLGETA